METLVVRVEDRETAMLIKKVLEEFRTVIDVGIAKNNYISQAIEEYELREDAKAYRKAKAAQEKPLDLDAILKEMRDAKEL